MSEIVFHPYDVRKAGHELKIVQRNIINRHLSVDLSTSQGESADAFQEAARALQSVGNDLATILGDVGTVLEEAARRFENADNSIEF